MAFETNGLAQREQQFIVGREHELKKFKQLLKENDLRRNTRILHIYGTGGVGKSTFLRLCQGIAEEVEACFVMLDSRDFVHTEDGFCTALLKLLMGKMKNNSHLVTLSDDVRENCITLVSQIAKERPLVLALDTFEEMMDMEAWFRDRFAPWLPSGTIVLLAGRHPLKGTWILSPAWRELIQQLPLSHLNRENSGKYAKLCGIQEDDRIEYLWKRSKGHPLTLSMAVAAQFYGEDTIVSSVSDWFEDVASRWLKEVPDDELRAVVEAASVLRRFNQELLSFVMEKDISIQVFNRLKSLSFVQQSVNGWQFHDLISEITSNQLRERAPGLYNRYKERSAYYYAEIVIASSRSRSTAWEIGELFRYADIKVLKAMTRDSTSSSYYWEAVTESTLADAAAYVEWRENCEEGVSGIEIDLDTGEQFLIDYPVEALRLSTGNFNISKLFQLAPESLKLLRDRDGRVHALSVIVPMHAGTLSWLEQDPICQPYLASLTSEERSQLEVTSARPAGWFMRIMDFVDLMDPALRTQAIHMIYAHMCMGGIFVCSPITTDITKKIYPALGLQVVEGAAHTNYDGNTITNTYAIDTRGNKLCDFIDTLFRKAGLDWKRTVKAFYPGVNEDRRTVLLKQFTTREQEVIECVVTGCSNAEVASRLFISEVTVKKHLKSIYVKLGISTRTQLVSKMMAES
ncbi:LuxR family transcriptional regulator [Paenibacillus andongensis]|uniref:LuxR C-terminal-related transcriptional regulator n=1 Tax=Paenibacillus andongensis TaxID=2975482 RepID=UPI0021BB75F7|nr:LuxR family transcriptional regulator [Paenibacillus andongensis]